jgi:hypothetical protein
MSPLCCHLSQTTSATIFKRLPNIMNWVLMLPYWSQIKYCSVEVRELGPRNNCTAFFTDTVSRSVNIPLLQIEMIYKWDPESNWKAAIIITSSYNNPQLVFGVGGVVTVAPPPPQLFLNCYSILMSHTASISSTCLQVSQCLVSEVTSYSVMYFRRESKSKFRILTSDLINTIYSSDSFSLFSKLFHTFSPINLST